MRWNCPHCETSLAVSEEKLGTGWSFSRCYHCNGFALVRRAALSVIKVDRAPAGETVLLPEPPGEPVKVPMLNATAKENYDRLGMKQTAAFAATAIPEAAAATTPPPIPPDAAAAVAEANRQTSWPTGLLGPEIAEEPRTLWVSRPMLVLAIGVTTTLAASSGYYLFSEGQQLWEKARTTAGSERRQEVSEVFKGDSPEVLRPAEDRILVKGDGSMTDQVRLQAMAPSRGMIPPTAPIGSHYYPDAPANAPAATGTAQAPTAAMPTAAIPGAPQTPPSADALASTQAQTIPAVIPAPPFQGPQPPRADLKDIAAAPANEPSVEIQQPTPLVVRIRTNEARLHAGPGVQYPIVAMARPDARYAVADWSDRWFKVAIRLPTGTTMAWIRNDQVLISPAGPSETLPDAE